MNDWESSPGVCLGALFFVGGGEGGRKGREKGGEGEKGEGKTGGGAGKEEGGSREATEKVGAGR